MQSIPRRLALCLLSLTALPGPAPVARPDAPAFLPPPAPRGGSADVIQIDLKMLIDKDKTLAVLLYHISDLEAKIEKIREMSPPGKFKKNSAKHQAILDEAQKALKKRREELLFQMLRGGRAALAEAEAEVKRLRKESPPR
jgi:hypothetical protein